MCVFFQKCPFGCLSVRKCQLTPFYAIWLNHLLLDLMVARSDWQTISSILVHGVLSLLQPRSTLRLQSVALFSFLCCLFLGSSFISQISWHVPNFQTRETNFSKARTDMETTFSLKQDQRIVLCKQLFKKVDLMDFSQRSLIFDPLYLRIGTEYRDHSFVKKMQAFNRLLFSLILRSIFFIVIFWAKKRMKKSV